MELLRLKDVSMIVLCFQLSAVHGIQSAFDEAMSYCRYHPSKGYWWHFKDQEERGEFEQYKNSTEIEQMTQTIQFNRKKQAQNEKEGGAKFTVPEASC